MSALPRAALFLALGFVTVGAAGACDGEPLDPSGEGEGEGEEGEGEEGEGEGEAGEGEGEEGEGEGEEGEGETEHGSCGEPLTLVLGDNSGNLDGAPDATDSFCTAGGSGEDVWTFTTDGPTELTLTITSGADLGVAVRDVCDDVDTEIDCADSAFGGEDEILVVTVDGTVAITIEGFLEGDAGPYTLRVEAAPVVCGDAIVAGDEECDGANLDGLECQDVAFGTSGTLVCDGTCLLDATGCAVVCGDEIVGAGEQCDGLNFDFADCNTVEPGTSGTLVCDGSCAIDSSGCAIVCGDAIIGAGEECDDGNPDDGDGCSSACVIEACLAPLLLDTGGANTGDLTTTANVTDLSCTFFFMSPGPEEIYSFDPGGLSGDLTLTLTSAEDLGVGVRTQCAVADSEIGCVDIAGGGADEVLTVAIGEPVTVIVETSGFGLPGPYSLAAEFVPSVCGDAIATGLEECDDQDFRGNDCNSLVPGTSGTVACDGACVIDASGCAVVCGDGIVGAGEGCDDTNLDDGDGCSSACAAEVCLAPFAAVLGVDANAGDTSLGTGVLTARCTGAGTEEAWEYLPEVTGLLDIALTSAADLGVYARTECGNAATEIGCIDVGFSGEGELLTVQVQQGTPMFIFVDSFQPAAAGPYTFTLTETELALDDVEPNDTFDVANPFVDGFDGFIGGGDVDCVSFDANPGDDITVEITAAGCADFSVDSAMTLFDTDGITVLDQNDDAGGNFCSVVTANGVAGGTYFACPQSSPIFDPNGTFLYTLVVTVAP